MANWRKPRTREDWEKEVEGVRTFLSTLRRRATIRQAAPQWRRSMLRHYTARLKWLNSLKKSY